MSSPKDGQDEEQQAFLESPCRQHNHESTPEKSLPWPPPKRQPIVLLRLLFELAMAVTIVVLLARPFSGPAWWKTTVKLSPIPQFPRKTYTFLENSTYLNENMFASREATLRTLHNWIDLSAAARGYIHIPDWANFDIGQPYTVAIDHDNDGPAYMMSVFHQLHCLSYIVEHFQSGYGGVELDKEVAHHSAHCFDYLRQSIMCAGDTNLEGKTAAGPGWGSEHQCVDYDALLQWANEHGALAWRGNMPDEAVL